MLASVPADRRQADDGDFAVDEPPQLAQNIRAVAAVGRAPAAHHWPGMHLLAKQAREQKHGSHTVICFRWPVRAEGLPVSAMALKGCARAGSSVSSAAICCASAADPPFPAMSS